MKKISIAILCLGALAAQAGPGDTVTVAQCRRWATEHSPLQEKKRLSEEVAALQLRNISSNDLPRIAINGQGSYQSDVFKFPIENPLFAVPEIPKDQYKLTADVAQRIWDGRSDRLLREQRDLERALGQAQVDVDAFQLREMVTDLYFKALASDETRKVLETTLDDLKKRRFQAESWVKEGIALRSVADQLSIQILKTEQQLSANQSDKLLLLSLLEHWTGQDLQGAVFTAGKMIEPLPEQALQRPEYQLFILQERQLALQKSMLKLREQPRIEAFGQAGYGRPNPFNFFKTGISPFGIVGLRIQWTPIDWGNRKRDTQALSLQSRNIGIQKAVLDQRLKGLDLSDQAEIRKYLDQLPTDDKIIALQEDILKRAEAQVQNGVMTSTDYLSQINLLTQARLNRQLHVLQAQRAAALRQSRTMKDEF